MFSNGRDQRSRQKCDISVLFCTSEGLRALTCSGGAVKTLLSVFGVSSGRQPAVSPRAAVQILNNDRKPLIKLGPLRRGGGGWIGKPGREIICIDYVTLSLRPSPRINISSGALIIFNHPAETKAAVIDTASTCSTWGSFPSLSPPLTALTDTFKGGGGHHPPPRNRAALQPRARVSSPVGECVSACSFSRNQEPLLWSPGFLLTMTLASPASSSRYLKC